MKTHDEVKVEFHALPILSVGGVQVATSWCDCVTPAGRVSGVCPVRGRSGRYGEGRNVAAGNRASFSCLSDRLELTELYGCV